MEWWGPVIWETYGGMEGAATIAKPHRWLEKPGTVGRAVRGVQLDHPRRRRQRTAAGRDRTRSTCENDVGFTLPRATTSSTAAGVLGASGSRSATSATSTTTATCSSPDRAKDMIITGGTNVYPAEVEAVLLDHPAVARRRRDRHPGPRLGRVGAWPSCSCRRRSEPRTNWRRS